MFMKRIKNAQLKKWITTIGILIIAVFIIKIDVQASNWYDALLNSTNKTYKVKKYKWTNNYV